MIGNKVWANVDRLTGGIPGKFQKGLSSAFQNQSFIHAIEYAVRLILGILLSSAQILREYAPFGIGFVAASGTGVGGLFAIAGAMLGSVLADGFVWATKYVAISVLVFAAAFVFKDTKMYNKNWFMPLIGGIMTACTGFVYVADSSWGLSATAFYIMETVLAASSAYFYLMILSPHNVSESDPLRRRVSVLILLATILISLSRLNIFGIISIGRFLAVIAVMTAAYKGGMAWGSVAGIAFGISMDCAAGSPPFFTACFSLAGLISGICFKSSRLLFILSYILTNAVASLWNWESVFRESVLYETFIASVVFMLLPGSALLGWKESFIRQDAYEGPIKAKAYVKVKTERAARAFRDIYDILKQNLDGDRNDGDIATVFDMAAEVTCRKCRMTSICWNREYINTFNAMNDVSQTMMKRGSLWEEDFPSHFRDRCLDIKGFTEAVNTQLRALMQRRQFKNRLRENQNVLYAQYMDMSFVLKSMAEELDITSAKEKDTEKRLKLYLRGIETDISGGVFCDKNGRLHIELEGQGVLELKKNDAYLDKLSAVVGKRLCEPEKVRKGILVLLEAEPLAASVGIASMRRRNEHVNGDNGTYFKTDEGILCVILSDGMGSGIEAARDSAAAVKILERFLKAGVQAETALRILSSVMLLRGEEDIACATVDLMCINLFTGDTQMFKYGASPSYVKKGKSVRRVKGESLAAGLGNAGAYAPDCTKVRLEAGSLAVIASDGVANGQDDTWIADNIEGYEGRNAKELARSILDKAVEKYGCEDDMTVLSIAVENRN
ncbi:MAG: SpoIIE family protein phosphatase [Clostridiales bacterium]|nr:SpoIIE family protein phosphatase [Clostridiales bacterium]